ncbi:MAG: hypothetical protein JO119_18710 [Acidobacteria bacterium]|nr:hypothetical protein [Acidobacteriota bacterium]
MLCEEYKPALIEAAISGAQLAPAIRTHVVGCPLCAAELAQQRSLVAAINANLHRQMNAPVPAAMLQRFEAHLAQHPQPKRAPRFAQVFAGALATLAFAAIIVLLLPRHRSPGNNTKLVAPQPTENGVYEPRVVRETPSNATVSLGHQPKPPSHALTRFVLASAAASPHPEPEVIVPPDERIAMEHFIADLHGDGEIALARAKRITEQREQAIVPVDAPDIQIAALKVQPIRQTDMGSDK